LLKQEPVQCGSSPPSTSTSNFNIFQASWTLPNWQGRINLMCKHPMDVIPLDFTNSAVVLINVDSLLNDVNKIYEKIIYIETMNHLKIQLHFG
jgi:hypothetical protein